jgi:type IV secretory pathway TrbD component
MSVGAPRLVAATTTVHHLSGAERAIDIAFGLMLLALFFAMRRWRMRDRHPRDDEDDRY